MKRGAHLVQTRGCGGCHGIGTDGRAMYSMPSYNFNGQLESFADGGTDLFNHIKQLTIFGYYTSKIGMTIERRYLPVPGRYDGAYPYDKVRTLSTS